MPQSPSNPLPEVLTRQTEETGRQTSLVEGLQISKRHEDPQTVHPKQTRSIFSTLFLLSLDGTDFVYINYNVIMATSHPPPPAQTNL